MILRFIDGAKASAWHLSLIGITIGLLWAGIGLDLWRDYKAAEQSAAKDTANLALSFDEDITRTVEAVDQTLLFVREAYQHDGTNFLRGAWTKSPVFLDDFHVQLGLADRDGKVIWSNLGLMPVDVNLADREHFREQKQSVADHLLISRPVLGRISGKWTIQFVRKLLTPDGSFDGIVVVSLDASYLSRFYRSISIGNGSILLSTTSGVVLARAPEVLPIIGGDLPPDTKVRMLSGSTSGAFRAVSSIDHVERIFSSRLSTRYPLLLAVGLATADVFASYQRDKRLFLSAGVVLSFVCFFIGCVVLGQRRSLLDSRQALSATLENMSQGIAMVLPDGRIPVLNQRAIDLLGLPPEFAAGRSTFQQIIDWQCANNEFGEPDAREVRLARVFRGSDIPSGNYTYERTRPNGSVLEIRTQWLPEGGFVRTITEITERKRNEAVLIAAQARAAHAERMQALGQLAGGIAHDFNNILQAVQGGASLIHKRATDAASVRRFACMIMDTTDRGSSITRRLLAFARRGELSAEAVDLAELLTGLRDVFSHTLGSGITVDVGLTADLPPLIADKGQLETALVNLATNGRDAMPDGGTLTFTAVLETVTDSTSHEVELRPGQYLRVSIADTGTGIDAPVLARVMEPFFSTKPQGQGTGLGLSMAKGFVEQSGGGLTISSTPGHGTTVNLWLPAALHRHASGERTAKLQASRLAADGDSVRHVLLVDDESMVRETLALALEECGYNVSVATNGMEALNLLRSDMMVDVLVTDLSMPGVDGLELIRQAQRERPGLPAVLLTGYTGVGAQLAMSESMSGAFSLLRKPATVAQLADRIEALLAVSLAG